MTSGSGSGGSGSLRDTPFDVWLCVLLMAGAGIVFMVESLIRLSTVGGAGLLQFPATMLLFELAAAAGALAGARWARPVVLIIVILAALLHIVIVLGDGPGWTRIVSGVLAASQIYALVVLNTKPVREHFRISR
ncbi:MAG TPA: hypothetical protein VHW44_12320 [Pseudonocardiaceae bacterium]|jgi:hypothetical protein|nr:hypothetical protein [Pseudonocardiaceae bacterium]